MIERILCAVFAGIMLGIYALPKKFTKRFVFEINAYFHNYLN
jgi:hypothetical protein